MHNIIKDIISAAEFQYNLHSIDVFLKDNWIILRNRPNKQLV